jgi:3-hydroxyacyl-[acyl-carrier-protein] dehydratase
MMSQEKESVQSVFSFLPHRYPFLLIDAIESVEVPHIICKKLLSNNEPVFQGHFPGYPVFPGVMTLEACAQASGILLHHVEDPEKMKDKLGVFAGIDQVRFRKILVPGETMTIHSEYLSKKMGVYFFKVSVQVESQQAMSGNIQVVLAPAPEDWALR